MAQAVHCNNLFIFFFFPRNSQQVQDCGGYLQEKAKLQGKKTSNPAYPALSNWGQGNPANYLIY